ncbi:hypothetical protein EGI16_00335 [Chryseobacterium sp. G0240]|uniref:hypothetical protein n=1 Tax=Chryseobacterium sp. G0240 TaxID=2487066 RepID=UPI000F451427|nr:hypothetical protein [Chryseobacterium sp. G0240]ROI06389.1 hypothetical protein EGI16_00335 [Chryseobacterium sp. G0240]
MKTYVFIVSFAFILLNCNQKNNDSVPLENDILVEDFNFTENAIIDTLEVPEYLKSVVKSISSLNIYETGVLGKGQTHSPNFENYKHLLQLASDKDLLLLTENKNNAVAVYAAIGLVKRKPGKVTDLFKKLLDKRSRIHVQNGCLISEDNLAEPLYWKYYHSLKPEQLRSDPDLKKLNSMILPGQGFSEYILLKKEK